MAASTNPTIRRKKDTQQVNRSYHAFANVYDRIMGDAVFPTIRRGFDLAVRTYRIPYGSVADIGCGSGRFIQYLAWKGVPVWGVDISPSMLKIASRRNRSADIKLLQQDITRLSLPKPVDLITCNFDTLNYILSEEALVQVFSGCRENLSTNGHIIFDCIAGTDDRSGWKHEIQRINLPGILSRWIVSWSPRAKTSVVNMRYVFTKANGQKRLMDEVHVQKWHPMDLMTDILERSGFKVLGVHDAETFQNASLKTFWTKYIAQRL